MNLGAFRPKFIWIYLTMTWIIQYFWILPFCMGSIITIVETEQTSLFTWNKSNPMFTEEGGAKLSIPVGSNFKIICPQQTNTSEPEYYIIYWVSQKGYDNCFLPTGESQILVICDKPWQPFDFTVEITIFSGTPGAKDFKVGDSYFISSFSTGTYNGLNNTYKGACKEHNMKINLTVTEQQLPSTPAPSVTTKNPRSTSSNTPSVQPPSTTPRPTTNHTTTVHTTRSTYRPSTHRPPYTTDIPTTENTDSIINVPDNGNTGVIDITNNARTLHASPAILLTLVCLSTLHHILYTLLPLVHR